MTAGLAPISAVDAGKEWCDLVEKHLPVALAESAWRSSAIGLGTVPAQGWKLHVSATVLSAVEVLQRTAAVLNRWPIHWKAARTLDEVQKLNCGVYYGYSQIGKIITVYSADADVTVRLARELDEATAGLAGPRVPFDNPLRTGSLVHYRFGVLHPQHFLAVDGVDLPALRDPTGHLVVDRRGAGRAIPEWVTPLIQDSSPSAARGPLATQYVTYEAITQRGKGGTYRALDLSSDPIRRCIVREGRRHGETDWDGRDGRDRVDHELYVLRELSARHLSVPEVLDDFVWDDHRYLILESLDGPDLQRALAAVDPPFTVEDWMRIARQAVELVANLHNSGWAWRDCKPANLVVTPGGVYAVDFEGACRLDSSDPTPWGSPGHVPAEWPRARPVAQDLYALGAVLAATFGRLTEKDPTAAAAGLRIAAELQDKDPSRRPPASQVLSRL